MRGILFLIVILSFPVLARQNVIYGEDNRVDVHESSSLHKKLARSVLVSVPKRVISPSEQFYSLPPTSFGEWMKNQTSGVGLCSTERFQTQPNPGVCTGFLIAPDLILTAGHCSQSSGFCSRYNWIVDFVANPLTGKAGNEMRPSDIYSCKRVISSVLNESLGLDYAIVQLDRSVEGRAPLAYRTEGEIEDWSEVFVIGSPLGLPLKVAVGAKVRENSHPFYFNSNLDTYEGNSGSPVFNAITGVVEGILTKGENDFVENKKLKCMESNRCDNSGCRGEEVARVTSVPEIATRDLLHAYAEKGDVESLKNLLKLKTWVDFYGADGRSALMKAAARGHTAVMEILIQNGADVNLKDAQGNTALHHLARAQTFSNKEALDLLLRHNADLNLKNKSQESPLSLFKRIKKQFKF